MTVQQRRCAETTVAAEPPPTPQPHEYSNEKSMRDLLLEVDINLFDQHRSYMHEDDAPMLPLELPTFPTSPSHSASSCSSPWSKRPRVDDDEDEDDVMDQEVDGDDDVMGGDGSESMPFMSQRLWESCAQAGTAPYSPPECFEHDG